MIYEMGGEFRVLNVIGYCLMCLEYDVNHIEFEGYEYLEELQTTWRVDIDKKGTRCYLFDDSLYGVYVDIRKIKSEALSRAGILAVRSISELLTNRSQRYYDIEVIKNDQIQSYKIRLPNEMV